MRRSVFIVCILALSYSAFSQNPAGDSLRQKWSSSLTNIYKEVMLRPGRVTVDSIALNERKQSVELHTNLSLSYLPMRENTVLHIYDSVRYHLPSAQKKYSISVFSDG